MSYLDACAKYHMDPFGASSGDKLDRFVSGRRQRLSRRKCHPGPELKLSAEVCVEDKMHLECTASVVKRRLRFRLFGRTVWHPFRGTAVGEKDEHVLARARALARATALGAKSSSATRPVLPVVLTCSFLSTRIRWLAPLCTPGARTGVRSLPMRSVRRFALRGRARSSSPPPLL